MSKKHFIALADELRQWHSDFVRNHGQQAYDSMVDLCVSFCRSQNYRFDTDRFRGYVAGDCGPCGGKVKS
jgi:hypothetical protein